MEAEKRDAEIKKQRIVIILVALGLGITAVLAFFIFRGYRQKKLANEIISLQKREVEHQKYLIEEKQKEILDSIHYAKRIQRSLLPTEKYLQRTLARIIEEQRIKNKE